MNIKATAAVYAAAASLAILSSAPANAATARDGSTWDFCAYVMGGEFCADYHAEADIIRAIVPGQGEELMGLSCTEGRALYESRGDWTKQQVEDFANTYCASRGWNAHPLN